MHSPRFTKLQAALVTATTPVTRCSRSFRFRPLQKAFRSRAYASGRNVPEVKTSDVPWIAGAAMAGIGGVYFVANRGPRHDSSHDTRAKAHKTDAELDVENDEVIRDKKITKKDDPSKPGGGRPDPEGEAGLVGHGPKDPPKAMEPGATSPDVSDKPDPRGKPKSFNWMSGKQEGLSNADTHHNSQISKQPEKSKKGEGVAESAKLKGTVSTNRPGPENKEERGKAQMEKK